eukprot:jgi/Astpho2/5893/fgenesh1_pg.00080_%23_108_t
MSGPSPSDVEVTQEDQHKINAFGRLNVRMHELKNAITTTQGEIEALEDAANELMLADEEQARYGIGDCFLAATPDEAEAFVQEASDKSSEELQELTEELAKIQESMADLKKDLYAKLGDSINLEE